jgi:hypothetical protein
MRTFSAIAAALALTLGGATMAQDQAEPTQVMVLGTYHFANPGRDLANMQADDVLAEQRQRELAALAEALAAFAPDKILVERQSKEPDLAVAGYREFEKEQLGRQPDETVQIGFRLAEKLGHDAVYGFDEQPGEGEPDYFPFQPVQDFAVENGMSDRLEALVAEIRA